MPTVIVFRIPESLKDLGTCNMPNLDANWIPGIPISLVIAHIFSVI